MSFPIERMRRLRKNDTIRNLVCETHLEIDHLVQPIFVIPGKSKRIPINSMPGQFHLSPDEALKDVLEMQKLGIKAIIIFGIPPKKDCLATSAYSPNGIVQNTVKLLRKEIPDITIITDVCLCQYTNHGHCGILKEQKNTSFTVDNDATLPLLAKTAVSHARAGADIVAPSAMMDGQVKAIRETLDSNGLKETLILSYSAKFASSLYGPFRDAAHSAPSFGDRTSYQISPTQSREAVREAKLDIEEGADIVMVKPALPYLDIIRCLREEIDTPIAAYNVSGEYSMIKSAAMNGWLDEKRATIEILTSIKRAGADIIITYHARDVALWKLNK